MKIVKQIQLQIVNFTVEKKCCIAWAVFVMSTTEHVTETFKVVLIIEQRHEKTCFYICKNKDADQLCCNIASNQGLCFYYTDCKINLLPNSEMSSL